ncbi:MAG: HlyD family efflux transporter periplasmic adaptor subunit [Saprospiraceae bacterium]|nr:HlyD family efflux transporter periplasmic adaptor subunit [Saprospiraceae bacterium]
MLNISPNSINKYVDRSDLPALRDVEAKSSGRILIRILLGLLIFTLILLFLPWTQNISARGKVTTLKPDQRPQTIHSIIPGRIEKWYVQEGDYVNKGDTIMYISEIKDEYLDPQLLRRTQDQMDAKSLSVGSYRQKVTALSNQIRALTDANALKFQQAENKLLQAQLRVTSDSMDYEAAIINHSIAKQQFDRMEKLYADGLKSLTDFEKRKLTLQKAQAYKISAENKLLASRNEKLNAMVELDAINAEYQKEIAKATSEKSSALSNVYEGEATITKMQNQYQNYSVRSGYYYILSPQNGYVTEAIQSGLGETIKEGAPIVSIMPAKYDFAVAMYIKPLDLPLIEKGQHVRLQFDGWPAIVFSGWPNTSHGTYGGTVFAIDNFISDNGLYRVLVKQDPNDYDWPIALRVGGGAFSMLLLKDVPIWYEIWRLINGFPPDFYQLERPEKIGEINKAIQTIVK